MRIFEFTGKDLELYDGERLIGVYASGLRYTCRDDESSHVLAANLDEWLADGRAKIVEQRERTAGPAEIAGQGEVR